MTSEEFKNYAILILDNCTYFNKGIKTLHNNKTTSFIKKHESLHNYIMDATKFIKTSEKVSLFKRYKMVLNDITEYPKCMNPECSNDVYNIEKKICSEYDCKLWFKTHTYNIQKKHREKTIKEKYGSENVFNISEFQNKAKQTIKEKYGVDNISQHKESREKAEDNMQKNNGGIGFASTKIKNKVKVKMLDKYGVEYALQSNEIQNKVKKQMKKDYGKEYYFQTEIFKEQRDNSLTSKFGKDYQKSINKKSFSTFNKLYNLTSFSQLPASKSTIFNKYGVTNISKSPYYRRKAEKTMLDLYGVNHILQNPMYAEKALTNSFKFKQINGRKFQGYEYKTYTQLLKKYNDNEILDSRCDMPEIWYNGIDGKKHRYYPDFFIPHVNLIIETKSKYTMFKDLITLVTNMKKEAACIQMGFDFSFDIYE